MEMSSLKVVTCGRDQSVKVGQSLPDILLLSGSDCPSTQS